MEEQEKVINRDEPESDGAKLALISKWHKQLRDAKSHHRKPFDRIRSDMNYALNGKSKEWNEDKYVANIIQRHINQSVANLYAKNPRAVAKRRTRLEYRLWDGDQMSLM